MNSRRCNPATNRRQARRKIAGKLEIRMVKGTSQSAIFCRFHRDVLQNSSQNSSQIGSDIYERPSANSGFNEDNRVFWDVRPLSTHHCSLAILCQPHCSRYFCEQRSLTASLTDRLLRTQLRSPAGLTLKQSVKIHRRSTTTYFNQLF